MNKNIDIKLLKSFIAVQETGSFTSASKKLNITQPAISQHISRLESMLENALFSRERNKLNLTDAGERLSIYARDIINVNNKIFSSIDKKNNRRKIRIGMPEDIIDLAIPELAKHSDEYDIEISSGLSNKLYKDYEEKKYDIVIVKSTVERIGIKNGKIKMHWLDSKEKPAFKEKVIPISVFPEGGLCRDIIFNTLNQLGKEWEISFIGSQVNTLSLASELGFGLTLLPHTAIRKGHYIIEELHAFDIDTSLFISIHTHSPNDPEKIKIINELWDSIH